MPWKQVCLIRTRSCFVEAALKARESFAQTCRSFQISRKTGYKWLRRFRKEGRRGLRDQKRRPKACPVRTAQSWLRWIKVLRRRYRRWGARKIHQRLRVKFPGRRIPAVRTITRWLQRLALSKSRRRRSPRGPRLLAQPLTVPAGPNHVWTVDFKGWFRTTDGQRVEPLTVRDLFSRYILEIRLLADQQWWRVRQVFMRLFARRGKPKVIRVDNGFGSTGPAGLSRLSAWWTALGIGVEFIAPGHPEQNGSHEQMHREFKADLTRPASSTARAQQRRINRWIGIYNQVRPHQALDQRTPVQVYRWGRGQRCARRLVLKYSSDWQVRRVRSNGQIRWQGRLRFIGEAFVGMKVGLKPVEAGRHQVYLKKVLLGELHATDPGGLRPASYFRTPTLQNPKV